MHKPIQHLNLKPLLITTSLVLALAGCAGMNAKPAYVDASTLTPEQYADAAYVARVERIARMNGIDVTWVNAPHHLPAVPTKVAVEDEAP